MQRGAGRALLATCLLLAGLGGSRAASAGAFEVQGFGPAGAAEVNARGARADDGSATFYNPGGLALGRGFRTEIAPMFTVSALSAQGQNRSISDPFGVAIAFDATLPFEGLLKDRIRIGFGGYIPPTTAARVLSRPASEPFFPYFDNRTQRLIIMPALAVRLFERLGIGAALNVLAGVSGPVDVEPGRSGALESRLDLTAQTAVGLNVGLRFDPTDKTHLGLTFRQRFGIPAVVSTKAVVGGVPLDVDVTTHSALYDPAAIVVAGAFEAGRHSVEVDATYSVWSSYSGPFVAVKATLPGVDIESQVPSSPAKDVVSLRAADTIKAYAGQSSDLYVRAGLGYEPSMLKRPQVGETNLVDGNKILFGLGATVVLRRTLPTPVRLSLGVGLTEVTSTSRKKDVCQTAPCPADTVSGPDAAAPSKGVQNPGYPTLVSDGALWSMSASVGFEL